MPGGRAAVVTSGDAKPAAPAMRDRVPMWLAVAITVAVSLPFGLWLGDYDLPLWAAFIVWAEYFVLGARPDALRLIIPAFFVGVLGALGITTANALLERVLVDTRLVAEGDVAAFLAFFVGFCVFLYVIRWVPLPLSTTATLPFFNGVSLMLGIYFTDAFLDAAPAGIDPVLEPLVAAIGAMLACLLGCFLGWFNVVILFREPVVADSH
jgi:hypothetical protein